MKAAYVDTSCLLAIRFDQPGGRESSDRIAELDLMFTSHLTEAEFLAALVREGEDGDLDVLKGASWVLPTRPLRSEIERVLRVGYLRGPDLLHVATALYTAETPADLLFLTLDARQREVARGLGFPVD